MLNVIIATLGLVHIAGCICMAVSIVRSGLDYSPLGLAFWCQIWPLYFYGMFVDWELEIWERWRGN